MWGFSEEKNRSLFRPFVCGKIRVAAVLAGILLLWPSQRTKAQIMYPPYVIHRHSISGAADTLYGRGMYAYNAGEYDSSMVFLKRAFKIYDSIGDRKDRLLTLVHIVRCYVYQGKMDFAKRYIRLILPSLDDSIHDVKTAIYIHYSLAAAYEHTGNYQEGLRTAEAARKQYEASGIDDDWLIGRILFTISSLEGDFSFYDRAAGYAKQSLIHAKKLKGGLRVLAVDNYNSLGIFAYRSGNYDRAAGYLKKAISLLQQHSGWKYTRDRLLNGYINIGNTFFLAGDYQTALSYYRKALRMAHQILDDSDSDFQLILNNIAAAYSEMGNRKEALKYLLQTLPRKIRELGPDHPDVAVAYVNIGLTYEALKQYKKAAAYLDKGLEIRKKVYGEDNPHTLAVRNDLALVDKDQKKYRRALTILRKDLSVYKLVMGPHHPETASTLLEIGDVCQAMGRYHQALAVCQQALQSLAPGFHSSDIADNPGFNHVISEITFESALEKKAGILLRLSRKDRQAGEKYVSMAINTYEVTIRFIEKLRESYQAENSKYLLNEDAGTVYSGAVAACMLAYRLSGDEKYRKKAFNFSGRDKAGILMRSMAQARAQKYSGLPDSIPDKENAFRRRIRKIDRALARETEGKNMDSIKVDELRDELFSVRRRFQAFSNRIKNQYPSYYKLKYNVPHLTTAEIRQKLAPDQAYLGYFIGDSTMYTFEILKNGYNIITTQLDSALFLSRLTRFRDSIVQGNWQQYTTLGYRLYRKLLAPVEDDIRGKDLLIVPDPLLACVPFGALLAGPPARLPHDYSRLPYVACDHAITYGYSPDLLFRKTSRGSVHPTAFLGLAPVFDQSIDTLPAYRKVTNGGGISPLMSSVSEIKGIYHTISASPAAGEGSHIYLRSQATESKLSSPDISHYQYIHLATHAYINKEKPGLSGILFYPGHSKGTDDDGVLYTGEIYSLKLNARLVVLSACETAIGRVVRGEGIIGFTRAFLYAGARNVVVSLWDVSDQSAPVFMKAFYRYLVSGESVGQSLQKARIDMIHAKRYAMPRYWAAMIQIR